MREPEWARAWSHLAVGQRVVLALAVGLASGVIGGAVSVLVDVPWLLALYPVMAFVFGLTTVALVHRRRRAR
jgi:hypothetical protein